MEHPPKIPLLAWAPTGGDLPTNETHWEAFQNRDVGSLLHVSGWRSAGWIAAHLHEQASPFGWLQLDGCRTVADGVLALGTAMNLPEPGRTVDVATALGELELSDLVFDARMVSPDLVGALFSAVEALSPSTRWWAAIHDPLPVANHVATPESPPPIPSEPLPATIETGAWFSGTPRARLNLSEDLERPDAPPGRLRVDVSQFLQAQPRRSLGAVVDGLIGPHQDLFDLATEGTAECIDPTELFGLRLIAEYASDDNVACLAGAAAIRYRLRIGQPTEALERAEQVLVRTQRADPSHRALVIWAEANVQLQTGSMHRAQARFADAIALAESSRDKGLLATMNRRWADRLLARRLFSQASHRYRSALGLYRQRGDTEGSAASIRGAADVAVAAGELLSAEALFDQADLNTTTATEQVNRLMGQLALSIASKQWGRSDKIRSRIQRIGIPSTLDQANFNRREADRALRNGDTVTAAEKAKAGEDGYRQMGETAAAAGCLRVQADVAAAEGELQRAVQTYRQAIDGQARAGDWLGLARTLEHLAHLDQSRGNEDHANDLLELSREFTIAGGGS